MTRACAWCKTTISHGIGIMTLCRPCQTQMEADTMLERDKFEAYCKARKLPHDMTASLTRYVYDKQPPTGFMLAVLENHPILEVIRHGSPEWVSALKALYIVLHNEVPMAWYGSALAVAEHLSPGSGRTRRLA